MKCNGQKRKSYFRHWVLHKNKHIESNLYPTWKQGLDPPNAHLWSKQPHFFRPIIVGVACVGCIADDSTRLAGHRISIIPSSGSWFSKSTSYLEFISRVPQMDIFQIWDCFFSISSCNVSSLKMKLYNSICEKNSLEFSKITSRGTPEIDSIYYLWNFKKWKFFMIFTFWPIFFADFFW